MLDFIIAALPWIILGLCVIFGSKAVQRSRVAKEEKEDWTQIQDTNEQQNNKKGDGIHMAMGMGLGMCIGVVLGAIGLIPIEYGISLGMLIGMVVGMNMDA